VLATLELDLAEVACDLLALAFCQEREQRDCLQP
jgi:hypothetical protein